MAQSLGVAGTDAPLETADLTLIADDLSEQAFAIPLSHRTLAIIWQNIVAALAI